ncbi:MAG: transaldolase family protein, partial [Pseudomonadota bacterium]|nr:transaldolase family protein [Pseudomonadota bacterium]
DIGEDGMDLIRDIKTIYDNYPMLKTEILAASVRNIEHVKKAALYGADIATLPPQVVSELANHPLTDKGLKAFLDDWNDSGQKIL